MKEATRIYVEVKFIICPYCNAENSGWFGDPIGEQLECDECKKTFKVAASADVVFD